jgi:uncharacterized repeat protein (TIGR03803 family)
MKCQLLSRCAARAFYTAMLLLSCAAQASAPDGYNPATKALTMPTLAIGSASYSNVIVTVGGIVTPPSGTSANGSVDRYDPGSGDLTVQSVSFNNHTYYNVVVTVASLVSIGSVTGADSYDGTNLTIAYVQNGPTVYADVVVTEALSDVLSVAGGMPTAGPDIYGSWTHELAIPAVQVGNRVYTNVIVEAGKVLSAAGVYTTVEESILYSFTGSGGVAGSTDGKDPQAGLILGSNGNFYGTTAAGGVGGIAGTVFEVSPAGVETVLHSFSGMVNFNSADGVLPQAPLVLNSNGNYYGTTEYGGIYGNGTMYEITGSGTETVLYSFAGFSGVSGGHDGSNPGVGQLVLGSDGDYYGTTQNGGANNLGTVFKISIGGVETVLYSFGAGSSDAIQPDSTLILGSDGNFYGTTNAGGAYREGTVFRFTPATAEETVLHSFSGDGGILGSTDGGSPLRGLIEGSDGNFYGTTGSGGAQGAGTVFKITPTATETVLYSFFGTEGGLGIEDGASPQAPPVQGSDGNFYGTTAEGGQYSEGTIFKITPTGVETVLHSFSGFDGLTEIPDGGYPGAGQLLLGSDGNYYGTTTEGGAHPEGCVFVLTNVILPQ